MNKDLFGKPDSGGLADFRRLLLSWYDKEKRPLPWRKDCDPYRIWVSETMLQQTRVSTVLPYYRRFIDRFPDISSIAEADLQEVLKLWEGLGYYSRARNLHEAARRLAAEGSPVPDRWERLRALPGVGDYIAAAVLSIAFDKPYPVVDANVKRVLSRLFEVDEPVNRAGSHKVFSEAAGRLFDKSAPGSFNQAMMELGALVCIPRRPDCAACPVSGFCKAFSNEATAVYPLRVAKKPIPIHRMVIALVMKRRRLLIVRRPLEGLLGGLWEFPGGRLQPDETGEDACRREVWQSVGLAVSPEFRLMSIRHGYTHFRIEAGVFVCRSDGGRVRRNDPISHCWVDPHYLHLYPFVGSNHKIFPSLMKWYAANP
jgi:A/G-specific adenine glycosylase